jgi:hypothetical protein
METTTSATLRPLRIGEILDRAIRLYRRNFLRYIGIVAIIQIPIVVLQLLASLLVVNGFGDLGRLLASPATSPTAITSVLGPAYFAGASLNSVLGIISFVLVQGVASAALVGAVAAGYFGEAPGSPLDAYRAIRHKWFSMVAAILVAALLGIGLFFWLFVPCVGWFTGAGMLGYLYFVIVPLLAPIIVLEGGRPASAWRRAWDLARRRFWRVLGFALILYFFNLLVIAGPVSIVGTIGQILLLDDYALSGNMLAAQAIVQSVTNLMSSLLFLPLQVASITILYFDLRVRSEGLDLSLQLEEGSTSERLMQPSTTTLIPPAESLVKSDDMRNFLLVSLGLGASVLLFLGVMIGLAFLISLALRI